MANPSWVSATNVKFNGSLDNVVVLKDTGTIKSVILWDNLLVADQNILIDVINNNGGAAPLVGPTAGHQTLNYQGLVLGATSTGLDNNSAMLAGTAVINLGGVAVATSPSGLSVAGKTAGTQSVGFNINTTTSTPTGFMVPYAGSQTVHFTVAHIAADATGLANDATTYTTSVIVDGNTTPISVSIVGNAAQTFTALLGAFNTVLGAAATATLVGGDVVVTSALTGALSSVLMTSGTLFPALTAFSAIQTYVPGGGDASVVTATINIDGTQHNFNVSRSTMTTFADVVTAINTLLGAAGLASMNGPDIKITSTSTGNSSSVTITDGTLLRSLAGFVMVLPTQRGVDESNTYKAFIGFDGIKSFEISETGIVGNTYQHVVDAINLVIGVFGTAAIIGGNIVITSASTGVSSSVQINDTGFLFDSLHGYTSIIKTIGSSPTVYTASIAIDGINHNISVVGSAVQTFTLLVAAINTAIGLTGTAAITAGNIVITSASTGVSSSVQISDDIMFHKTVGYVGEVFAIPGAVDLESVLLSTRALNGTPLHSYFPIQYVGHTPTVPPFCPHTVDFIYFDGTAWRYLDNNAVV